VVSDHVWKWRCRKSASVCCANHASKSKRTKHLSVGALLEVDMSEKCTPLWREAHVQAKMYKTHHSRTTFGSCDVEKVHAVVARSTVNMLKTQQDHFWRFRCNFAWGFCTLPKVSKTWGFCRSFNHNHHYTTLHITSLHYTALHYNYNNYYNYNYSYHYTTLHWLHYTTLRYHNHYNYNYTNYTTLYYTKYITLHYT